MLALQRYADHDRDLAILLPPSLVGKLADITDESGHDVGRLRFVFLEVAAPEHEIEFETIAPPIIEELFDDGQLVLTHGVQCEVIGPLIAPLFSDTNLLLLVPLELATALRSRWRRILELQTRKYSDAQLPSSLDHLPHLVGA